MPRHDYFEQLSSLALLGDLSPEQMAELTGHLVHCSDCRTLHAELQTLTFDFLTVEDPGKLRASANEKTQIPELRERVIASARRQGLRISDEATLAPHSFFDRYLEHARRVRWEFHQWLPRAVVGVSIAAFVASLGILAQRLTEARNDLNEAKVHSRSQEHRAAELNDQLQQTSQAKDSTGGQLLRAEAELSAAKQRADELNGLLRGDRATIQGLQQETLSLKTQNSAATDHSAALQQALTAAQEQLQKLQTHASAVEVDLVTQQYQIRDLKAQLDTERLNTDRERELTAAGREIRDLMGARDLHMIDVRDVDLKGNWKQPYGRIFLTDNKQLIFYAFDLHKAGGGGKLFQVWGQKFGNESTVSLGAFHLDDQKQSRWIMKVSNPQLLSSIDSVFVTVENSAGEKRPTGKPLMNAYLRNPINHP